MMKVMLKPAALTWLLTAAVASATTTSSPTGGFYAPPAQEGVYVSDSSAAMDKLNLADRLAARGQWESAGSLLQEVLQKYADKVAPVQFNAQGKATSYIGMVELVHQHVARWPAQGRHDYANRYELQAHHLLEQAGQDPQKLAAIVRQYLETPSGRMAGMRLLDVHIESGQLDAAIWLAQTLLRDSSNGHDEGSLLYRLGWAAHLAGRTELAAQSQAQLRQMDPNATAVVAGQTVNLASALADALKQTPAVHDMANMDWPTFAGAADRAKIAPAIDAIGQKLYSIALPPPPSGDSQSLPPESRLGIMPIVDGGLFYQDGRDLFALDLNSGSALADPAASMGGRDAAAPAPQFTLTARDLLITTGPFTMTAGSSGVYAVMGAGIRSPRTFGQNQPDEGTTRLVCLDRRTAKLQWMISSRDLRGDAAVKALEFSGCPILVGEDLYVVGRGDTGNFQSCYLMRLDASTGQVKWVRYISGASVDNNMFGFRVLAQSPVSHPAYSQGRIFVDGEDGTVAALNADDGAVRWLSLYARRSGTSQDQDGDATGDGLPAGVLRPWASNPVIVKNGRVFVLPADGTDILVLDAGDGRQIKRIPRQDVSMADTLIGVWGDWIILTGQSRAWAIDWKHYSTGDNSRTIISSAELSPIRGRGLLTADALYVPTVRQLKRIDLTGDLPERGLMVTQTYPSYDQTWPKGEGPGNIIAADDRLIIAGSDAVEVYADWPRLSRRMLRRIGESPHDVLLRLSYAQMLVSAGQTSQSLEQLVQVASLSKTDAQREALFHAAMRLAQGRMQAGDYSSAQAFFQHASSAVVTPRQRVEFLLASASLAHLRGRAADEIRLLQEILTDPELRDVNVDASATPVAAGQSARRRIASLLKSADGQAAYGPVEKQAHEQLMQAQVRQDPQALLAVADDFPNSQSAASALVSAAQAYQARGNLILAREAIKRLLFTARDFSQPPELSQSLEMLAQLDLLLNRPFDAAARLQAAARFDPTGRLHTPLLLANGASIGSVDYSQAAAMIRHEAPVPVESAPTFISDSTTHGAAVSFAEDKNAGMSGIDTLISTLDGFERWDRVMGWSTDGKLILIQPGHSKPLATVSFPETPNHCAWIGSNVIIWGNKHLICLDGTGGQVLWRWSISQLPRDSSASGAAGLVQTAAPAIPPQEVVVRRGARGMQAGMVPMRPIAVTMIGEAPPVPTPLGPFNVDVIAHVRPAGSMIIVATKTGRIICLDGQTGGQQWVRRATVQPIQRLLTSDDFVVVRTVQGDDQSIVALNAFDGRELLRRTFSDQTQASPIGIALAPQGILIYTTASSIVGLDLFDPGDSDLFGRPQLSDDPPVRVAGRSAESGPSYLGMWRENQLLIYRDKILAFSDSGRFVRVHSLLDGRLLMRTDAQRHVQVPALLATGAQGWVVSLQVSDGRLYVRGPQSIACYSLADQVERWKWRSLDGSDFQRLLIGHDLVLAVDVPGKPRPMRLLCFSRQILSDGHESGLLLASIPMADSVEWTPVDGGLYYLTDDHIAHFFQAQ